MGKNVSNAHAQCTFDKGVRKPKENCFKSLQVVCELTERLRPQIKARVKKVFTGVAYAPECRYKSTTMK